MVGKGREGIPWELRKFREPSIKRWIQFGQELKAMRDDVVRNHGYWIPADLTSDMRPKWIDLTEELETTIMDGDKPSLGLTALLEPCPKCKIIERRADIAVKECSVKDDTVIIWHSLKEICIVTCNPESKFLHDYNLAKRYVHLLHEAANSS